MDYIIKVIKSTGEQYKIIRKSQVLSEAIARNLIEKNEAVVVKIFNEYEQLISYITAKTLGIS